MPIDPIAPRPRRILRRLAIAAALVLATLGVLIAMAPRLLETSAGRRVVASRLDGMFAPGRLEVDAVRLSWTKPTRLEGLRLLEPGGRPVLVARGAEVSKSLWGLLIRKGRPVEVDLEAARFEVSRADDGRLDLAEALSGLVTRGDPGLDATIRAEGAELLVTSKGLIEPVRAERLELEVHARPAPEAITWVVALDRPDGQSLRVEGNLDRRDRRVESDASPRLAVRVEAHRWSFHGGTEAIGVAGRLDGRVEVLRVGGLWESVGKLTVDAPRVGGTSAGEGLPPLATIAADWAFPSDFGDGSRLNWSVAGSGVDGGRLDGSVAGKWDAKGRAVTFDALRVSATGRKAAGTYVLEASGRFDGGAGSLDLDVKPGPAGSVANSGSIRVAGLSRGGEPLRVEGKVGGDLAALDRSIAAWSGRDERGLTGHWEGTASLEPIEGGVSLAGRLDSGDASWPGPEGGRDSGPLELAVGGRYRRDRNSVELGELRLATPFGSAEAKGRLDAIDGPARVDLAGTFALDSAGLTRLLRDRVEPGSTIALGPGSFAIKGPIGAGDGGTDPLVGDLSMELGGVDVFGLKLDATRLGFHSRGREIAVDPIVTKLNGGSLRVEPTIDLDAEGGPVVRLDGRTSLADAAVNEEVSRRVLAFVAPVLDRTTRASGKVSVTIESAQLPLGGDAREADVQGAVLFRDVEFAPGPLARQVVGAIARREPESLRLDEPVRLSIADGKIHQEGLAIPIAGKTRLELAGWVDFDRNLSLVASLPFTPELVGSGSLLAGVVSGTTIRVPITGTLSQPKIDREAFNAGLKEMGQSLLVRGAGVGALKLFENLGKPRAVEPGGAGVDPVPRPTAAERKATARDRRNERRRERGLPPLPDPRG